MAGLQQSLFYSVDNPYVDNLSTIKDCLCYMTPAKQMQLLSILGLVKKHGNGGTKIGENRFSPLPHHQWSSVAPIFSHSHAYTFWDIHTLVCCTSHIACETGVQNGGTVTNTYAITL